MYLTLEDHFLTSSSIANVNLECEQVNIYVRPHVTDSGVDFTTINPQGNVPTLVLEDGTILNEGAAVLQYIADQAPGTVAPVYNTSGRYLVANALNFIATELHKAAFAPLFNPAISAEIREYLLQINDAKLRYANDVVLGSKKFLVGEKPSIADFYLYIVLTWCPYVSVDLSKYSNLAAFKERVGSLEKVIEAHKRMEGKPSHVVS